MTFTNKYIKSLPAKAYFLPVSEDDMGFREYSCMGSIREKNIEDWEFLEHLNKAKNAEYEYLYLPYNSISHPNISNFLKAIEQKDLKCIFEINYSKANKTIEKLNALVNINRHKFNIVISKKYSFQKGNKIYSLPNAHYTLLCISLFQSLKIINKIAKYRKYFFIYHLHLYVPLREVGCMTNYQIEILLYFIKYKSIMPFSPLGIEIYENRVKQRELEPLIDSPNITSNSSQSNRTKISAIISTFNNSSYLKKVVFNLTNQSIEKDHYEIIVVEDGSNQFTRNENMILLDSLKNKINYTYIYFPRKTTRTMGDSNFRVGIVRNIGARYSNSKKFVFLDSDIIVGPTFLNEIIKQLESHDLIQFPRYNLNISISKSQMLNYQEITDRDLSEQNDQYWEKFNNTKDWNNLKHKWKYVCTYALAVNANTFKKIGNFRKTYIKYGFEDTDLGYRVKDANFLLCQNKVFHLNHDDERSEFQNSAQERAKILKFSAKIFLHNNPSLEVFEALGTLVKERPYTQLVAKIGYWLHLTLYKLKRLTFKKNRIMEPSQP